MYFTLGVSGGTAERCTALTERALAVDPSVMPMPGPASVAWRAPDGRAALLHWGGADAGSGSGSGSGLGGASRAGTIWAGPQEPGGGRTAVVARTSVTR